MIPELSMVLTPTSHTASVREAVRRYLKSRTDLSCACQPLGQGREGAQAGRVGLCSTEPPRWWTPRRAEWRGVADPATLFRTQVYSSVNWGNQNGVRTQCIEPWTVDARSSCMCWWRRGKRGAWARSRQKQLGMTSPLHSPLSLAWELSVRDQACSAAVLG